MQFAVRSALIASSCLAIGSYALPASYSVVDVDGGPQTDTISSQPTTIIQTVTASSVTQAAKETVSVTVIQKPSAATSSSTPTSTSSTSALSSESSSSSVSFAPSSFFTSTPSLPSTSLISSSVSAALSTVLSVTTAPSVTTGTTLFQEATVTIVSTLIETPTQSSTSYYDDGMWHTYYPIKPAAETGNVAAVEERAAPLATGASIAARFIPASYNVVSWNETTLVE